MGGWTTVASFHEPVGAGFVQSVLVANGFDAELVNEHFAGLGIHYSVASGGIEVRVPSDQAEAARTLLAEAPWDEEE
jgi:hypothetical protein